MNIIIGDSIAVGISAYFNFTTYAKVGRQTAEMIPASKISANIVIISAGSNDYPNDALTNNLNILRKNIAAKVIWIIPNTKARYNVLKIANKYNDLYVDLKQFGSSDRVHPSNYNLVASEIKRLL